MSISTEAIEAAARVMDTRALPRDNATAALTAAAPYIQAAALRDAADALESHWAYGCELKHDGSEDRAIASAVQMTHENAEELRARADQLEAETK